MHQNQMNKGKFDCLLRAKTKFLSFLFDTGVEYLSGKD